MSVRDERRHVTLIPDASYCLSENLTNLNDDRFMCFKSEPYHVPGYCDIPYGSPVTEIPSFTMERSKFFIKALTVQSIDCTFTLAVNISKHYDWINSVVFGIPEKEKRIGGVVNTGHETSLFNFRDSELFRGDVCTQGNGERGVCKSTKECNEEITGPLMLCAGDTICC